MGVLLIASVDCERERGRIRAWHAGESVRMPATPRHRLRKMLTAVHADHELGQLEDRHVRRLLNSARGRVGWMTECALRARMPGYWTGGSLRCAALSMDTEMQIRERRAGPRALSRSRRSVK
jgi:hypothetical protein